MNFFLCEEDFEKNHFFGNVGNFYHLLKFVKISEHAQKFHYVFVNWNFCQVIFSLINRQIDLSSIKRSLADKTKLKKHTESVFFQSSVKILIR